ncbi:hypothetical protein [Lentzea sp. NPDC004782]|uniref:hypothetical protein n=1 Tax=Lentzea sp. NPDC004782 TaxID=3154458 RepID=UPI0033BA61F5
MNDLFNRYHELGNAYCSTTRAADPIASAEAVLNHPVQVADSRFRSQAAFYALWGELLVVVWHLRNRGVSAQALSDSRGLLSRNDVDRLIAEATAPTARSLAENWASSAFVGEVANKLNQLRRAGKEAEAERLRKAARPFLRVWFEQNVPADPPDETARAYSRPPEVVAAERAAWQDARRLVKERIREL